MQKRTISALAAGSEWTSQGQHKRRPRRHRTDVVAGSLSLGEYVGAGQAAGNTDGAFTRTEQEVRSICHDLATARRETGYQALGMFLLPAIWKYLAIEVTALEVQNGADVFLHTYTACPTAGDSMIFLISRKGHMMWGKPTYSTTAAN